MMHHTPPDSLDYPLLRLFQTWQAHDRSRGHESVDTDTYLTLLRALERGVGLWSRDDLKALCMALLVKPHHNENKEGEFERIFDKFIKTTAQQTPENQPIDDRDKPDNKTLKTGPEGLNPLPASTLPPIPVTDPSTLETQPDDQKQKKGTQITHVAFRHDADLIEGVSSSTGSSAWEAEANQVQFRLAGKYLPVEGRAVQQAMRSLRQLIPKRQQALIDLPATIRHVARRGYFDRLITRRSLTTEIPLVLLLDRKGSMVAFHDIVDQWAHAARLQNPTIPVYYFQNCPINYVFSDPWLTKPVTLTDWKKTHPDAFVLILSDAGAARGLYSEERLTFTRQFLKDIRPRRVAWLNPMPRLRWPRSSAAFIARNVPMFALDSLEFTNAFRYLKSKLVTL